MIPNSKAYAVLRDKSQGFLDFAVLTCTSVPTLVNEINTQGVTSLKPDHFKGAPDGAALNPLRGEDVYPSRLWEHTLHEAVGFRR